MIISGVCGKRYGLNYYWFNWLRIKYCIFVWISYSILFKVLKWIKFEYVKLKFINENFLK